MPSASTRGSAGPWRASFPTTPCGRMAVCAAPASTIDGLIDPMEAAHVVAALLSAALHAGWNAAVKASARPIEAMAAQMLMSAALVVPGLLWTGLPGAASWPWIAASTLMNIVTVSALLRAYELGGFGIVYPIVRAVSVLLVVPLAAWLAGDQ